MPAVVFDPWKDSRAQSQLAAQQRAVASQQAAANRFVNFHQGPSSGRSVSGVSNRTVSGSAPRSVAWPNRGPASVHGSAGRPVNQRVDLASTQKFRGNEGNDMMFPGKGRQRMDGTGGVKPANPRGGGNASSNRRYDPPAPNERPRIMDSSNRRYDPPAPNEPPRVVDSLAAAGETRTNGGRVQGTGGSSREYGARLNLPPGSRVTMDWVDRDGDGIDDRYQTGPGQVRGGGAGGGKPGSSAGSSTSLRSNPLFGLRGPRSYMGMEDRVRAGARSTAELKAKARFKERIGLRYA